MEDPRSFVEEAGRYLDGDMTAEERIRFEARCQQQPGMAQILEEQRMIRQSLDSYAEYKNLGADLDKAFADWKAENERIAATPPANPADRGQDIHSPSLKRIIWRTAGIAAAITLVITLSGVLFVRSFNNHKITSYTILRREIDNIKRSQNDLINGMQQSGKKTPADPGQYGGTGFAISTDGYIATNAHVIKGADSIYVETSAGEALRASLIYQDPLSDLAVLKITDSTFSLPALPYTVRKSAVPLGDEVYTLGYPRDEIVYGKGYVSAETGFRGDSNSYQISIPVNPGNSGGPLIDASGQVLGVITGKQSPSDDIAFAVKSSFLLDMLDSLPGSFDKHGLLSRPNRLQHLSRVNQLKKLQPYVFLVKVYN
jgi:S1-C subfamily serine protease